MTQHDIAVIENAGRATTAWFPEAELARHAPHWSLTAIPLLALLTISGALFFSLI
jgi:hypothetical protein